MRPKRIGISSGIRPSLDSCRSSIGSRRSLGGFQPPCAARGVASRSAFPAARRSSGGDITHRECVAGSVGADLSVLLSMVALLVRLDAFSDKTLAQRSCGAAFAAAANSRHQIDPSIDIDRAAGDAPGERRREIGAGGADIHDIDQFAERRLVRRFVQQKLEIFQARRRAGLQRPRRNRMDPYPLRSEFDRRDSGTPLPAPPSPDP